MPEHLMAHAYMSEMMEVYQRLAEILTTGTYASKEEVLKKVELAAVDVLSTIQQVQMVQAVG